MNISRGQILAWANDAAKAHGVETMSFHPVLETFASLAYEAGVAAQPAPSLLAFAQNFLNDYQTEDGMQSMKHYAREAQAAIDNAPPAAQPAVPLTPEQIIDIRRKTTAKTHGEWADTKTFARAIEAAHGITEKGQP
jgi:hypothetical protein